MLLIENLTVSYEKKIVLADINAQWEQKKIHGILGTNGAGKTTLLNTIYGLKSIEKGNITLNHQKVSAKDVSFLENDIFFYPYITGREYLELFRLKNPQLDIEKWNSIFELPLDNYITTYSSGMKKKLALMGIFNLKRPILMLDEPFNNLDIESSQLLNKLFLFFVNSGKTIILTSHILESLISNCDYIHYLSDQNIIKSYKKNEFHLIEQFMFSQKINTKLEIAKTLITQQHPQ